MAFVISDLQKQEMTDKPFSCQNATFLKDR
jgi:hypothetical protein